MPVHSKVQNPHSPIPPMCFPLCLFAIVEHHGFFAVRVECSQVHPWKIVPLYSNGKVQGLPIAGPPIALQFETKYKNQLKQ